MNSDNLFVCLVLLLLLFFVVVVVVFGEKNVCVIPVRVMKDQY